LNEGIHAISKTALAFLDNITSLNAFFKSKRILLPFVVAPVAVSVANVPFIVAVKTATVVGAGTDEGRVIVTVGALV